MERDGSRSGAWRRRIVEWAESFDPATRRAIEWPLGWATMAASGTVLLALASFHPALRPFFQLDFWPLLALQLLSISVTVGANLLERRPGLTTFQRGLSYLAIAFFFQLYASSLVTFSKPPGSFALAACPLLAVWTHAYLIRPTLAHPYPTVMHGLAMAVALALRSDLGDLAVFAVIAPLGLLGSLISGTIAERMQRARSGLEAQQSAIRAQELEARASEIGHLQERLFEILQSQHDARNALSTALLDAHDLLDLARAPRDPECRRLRDSATVLQATLARVARAVEDVRDLAEAERRRRGGDARPVPVWPLARRVAEALGRRFPGVRIECRAESAYAERAEASVSGGAESLNRMLENAVANACEGDGGARSRRVEVLVLGRPDTGSLGVEVRDDGPGFPSELLAAPIAAFRTTKPGGSGLGLYTTERLVHASGGWLRRANRPDGGAVLSMFLPEALAARSAAPGADRA